MACGYGATDNGTGSAVCLEAVRIIEKLGLKPRRTIRIELWGGEEQGLFGSRAYVARHFAEQEGDLKQASAIMAIFAYNAATMPEMLPRKALPQPAK